MITHSVIFAPLGQATRSEQVVDRLKNAIVTGLLEANEQLPNEAELSKLMGVSHITIREALNTLRNKNLIHTVRGRNGGSFVCELPKDQLRAEHPLREISSAFLADLGELHAAILSHSTKLACERSTVNDLEKLAEFIDVFAQALTPETRAQADMRCLLTLAAHAQSARLANMEMALQAEWASLVAMIYTDVLHAQVLQHYRDLQAALKAQNSAQAADIANQMLQTLTDALIASKFSYDQNQ